MPSAEARSFTAVPDSWGFQVPGEPSEALTLIAEDTVIWFQVPPRTLLNRPAA